MIDKEQIKQLVSISDILNYYGIQPNRAGFIRCISHEDRKPSMKVYYDTNSVHCWACQADYDVIGFVQKMEGCSFNEALELINAAFNLQLDKKVTGKTIRLAELNRQCRINEKQEEQKRSIEYQRQCERLHFLEKLYWTIVPKRDSDDFEAFMNDDERIQKSFELDILIEQVNKKLDELL